MSEEEVKALVEMKDMLKAENTKLKEHLKRTHQIMTEMNEEIAKLKQEKKELKKSKDNKDLEKELNKTMCKLKMALEYLFREKSLCEENRISCKRELESLKEWDSKRRSEFCQKIRG